MSTEEPEFIRVEVAYATREEQSILSLEVPVGTTADEAVRLSGIEEQFPEIDLGRNRLGVFGKLVKAGHTLGAGDRVEIYRPLTADPKVVRRELAALGKTMGKAAGKKAGQKVSQKVSNQAGSPVEGDAEDTAAAKPSGPPADAADG
jgi:putative ubiquitin-RnfH superfamily antitoxin RatB of RatAB toxin-antitoxin module